MEWEPLNDRDLHDSDHFPIKISKRTPQKTTTSILANAERWNTKIADWYTFSKNFSDSNEESLIIENIDEAVKHFTDKILQSAKKSIGKSEPSRYHNPVP